MSPNNGTLLNGVLRPKLVNYLFAFCSFRNLDFLLPQTEHFDCITIFLFLKYLNLNFQFFSTFYTISQHFNLIFVSIIFFNVSTF